ncbi:MAG: DUF2268 domain-containing putative Zn-dependent protease [Candidatus Pacearchaeota archaeon]
MRQKTLKNPKAEIYNFLDCPSKDIDKVKEYIIGEIPKTEEGYFGFKKREYLKTFMNHWFSKGKRKTILEKPEPDEAEKIVSEALKDLSNVIGKEKIYVYIIPEKNKFVKDYMEGVMGLTPHRKHIIIQPTIAKNWKKALKDIVAHELAHALSKNYSMFSKNPLKVKGNIIAEGLAEKFKEHVFRKKRNPWTKVFPKSKTKEYLRKVSPYLEKKGFKYHIKIFFNQDKEFPFWTGYTLGYHLVSEYLKDKKNVNWKNILRRDLEKIFNEAVKNLKE